MKYEIDNPDKVIDHWLRVFEAISINQFEKFSIWLGFPGNVTPELKGISKQFSLSILSYLGWNIPEQPLDALYVESTQVDPIIQIWMNIFSQLQLLGYANDIYIWGQNACRPLGYPIDANSFVTEWDILLLNWSDAPSKFESSVLNLPQSVSEKLQLIIKQYEINRQELRFQIRQTQETPSDAWEAYALKTLKIGSWINNHAQFQIQLAKWKTIFSTLSEQQLDTLDKWGYENFGPYNVKNYFSLLQFANEIQKSSPD